VAVLSELKYLKPSTVWHRALAPDPPTDTFEAAGGGSGGANVDKSSIKRRLILIKSKSVKALFKIDDRRHSLPVTVQLCEQAAHWPVIILTD
jgi:hypothetical protein